MNFHDKTIFCTARPSHHQTIAACFEAWTIKSFVSSFHSIDWIYGWGRRTSSSGFGWFWGVRSPSNRSWQVTKQFDKICKKDQEARELHLKSLRYRDRRPTDPFFYPTTVRTPCAVPLGVWWFKPAISWAAPVTAWQLISHGQSSFITNYHPCLNTILAMTLFTWPIIVADHQHTTMFFSS